MANLDEVSNSIKHLDGKIDRLSRAVIGDDEMGQEGLVSRVNRHDRWIEKQKLKEARIIGIGIGLGFVWTALLKIADKLF